MLFWKVKQNISSWPIDHVASSVLKEELLKQWRPLRRKLESNTCTQNLAKCRNLGKRGVSDWLGESMPYGSSRTFPGFFQGTGLLCIFLESFFAYSYSTSSYRGQPFSFYTQNVQPAKVATQGSTSSRMPGNHEHGNGLSATFVPGRRNVCEGYWATDES